MRKALISVGNPLKSDDNIANIIIEKIPDSKDLLRIIGGATPENSIPKIRKFKPDVICFLDAVEFGSEPGEVRLFPLEKLKGVSMSSTHNVSLDLFSNLFPKAKILVIGIQPQTLGFGEKLSRELEEKVGKITDKVKRLLQDGSLC